VPNFVQIRSKLAVHKEQRTDIGPTHSRFRFYILHNVLYDESIVLRHWHWQTCRWCGYKFVASPSYHWSRRTLARLVWV